MGSFRVTCHTPDNSDPDRRIQGLGGVDGPLGGWWYGIDTIIQMIIQGHYFYVNVGGHQVTVVVRQHGLLGRQYLTTEPDGFPPNNLLNLPQCPHV